MREHGDVTLISLQDGNVVMRDGRVGTEQDCCCGQGCDCENPSGTLLPMDTPFSMSSDCACYDGSTISGTGTLGDPFLNSCGITVAFPQLDVGFCEGELFAIIAAAWQADFPEPFPSTNSGFAYGSFAGCPDHNVTETGGAYSGSFTVTLDVVEDGVAYTCQMTITLG